MKSLLKIKYHPLQTVYSHNSNFEVTSDLWTMDNIMFTAKYQNGFGSYASDRLTLLFKLETGYTFAIEGIKTDPLKGEKRLEFLGRQLIFGIKGLVYKNRRYIVGTQSVPLYNCDHILFIYDVFHKHYIGGIDKQDFKTLDIS